MAKIYIFTTANNQVNWDNTRESIMNNANYFSDGYADFGIGGEPYVKCPGCGRNLPMVIFHLDHIRSQARYAHGNLGLLGGDRFVVLDRNDCDQVDARVVATGGSVTIQTGSIYAPKTGIVHSSEIWKNDLRNLQFLCSACNTSKGDLDWNTWGKTDNLAKPLSAIWKHVIPND